MGIGRTNNTAPQDIVTYWRDRVDDSDMGCCWSQAHECCWRCGRRGKKQLEKCHIIPHQEPFNGPDAPENFVLLCGDCHRDAPCINDPVYIWRWIQETHIHYENGRKTWVWHVKANQDLMAEFATLSAEYQKRNWKPRFTQEAMDRWVNENIGLHPGAGVMDANIRFALKELLKQYQRLLAAA